MGDFNFIKVNKNVKARIYHETFLSQYFMEYNFRDIS